VGQPKGAGNRRNDVWKKFSNFVRPAVLARPKLMRQVGYSEKLRGKNCCLGWLDATGRLIY
jgi:hypothetical protein